MSFDQNVGKYLQTSFVTNTTAHAYIVVAQKQSIVPLLNECAQVLLCKNHTEDDCEICQKVKAGEHQDVITFPMDKTKNRLTVADMTKLIDESYLRPVDLSSQARVFLIDASNSVAGIGSETWQNKLLKTLEEPPQGVYIVIGVTDLESLLPTVRSRCQVLKQSSLNTQQIVQTLQNMGYDSKTSQIAGAQSGGSLVLAQSLLANNDVFVAYNLATEIATNMLSTKTSLQYVSRLTALGENIGDCLAFICTLLRESLVYRIAPQLCLLPSMKNEISIICNNYTIKSAQIAIELINKAKQDLDFGLNTNVIIDNLINDVLEVRYRCR